MATVTSLVDDAEQLPLKTAAYETKKTLNLEPNQIIKFAF